MPRQKVHLQGLPLAAALLAALSAHAQINGAAIASRPRPVLWTWGASLTEWTLDTLEPRVLLAQTDLGPGCVAAEGLAALSRSRLVLLAPPRFAETVLEPATDFSGCLPFTISGRRGVLIPHLHAQLRFYEFARPGRYHELYSIYTASKQGGLLAHDVDRDGGLDLFFGNYWVRNPGRLGLPWRLFAVNTFFDSPDAALARLALLQLPGKPAPGLVWAGPGRLAFLERPSPVTEQWPPLPLEPAPERTLALLATADPPAVYAGHDKGVTRWLWSGGRFTASSVLDGAPVVALFQLPGGRILAVTPAGPRILR